MSPFERKVILGRDFVFDEFSLFYSKSDEGLGKAKDVTKQVDFKSSIIRNISDRE